MSKLRVLLKCIKKSAIWKFLIEYFFYPSLHFLWSFVFNFKSKILYYLWSFKKKDCFNLNNNDKLLVRNNTDFTEIGNKILLESEKLIPEAKKKLFDTTYSQEKKKLNEAAGELPYSIKYPLFSPPDLLKNIIKILTNSKK